MDTGNLDIYPQILAVGNLTRNMGYLVQAGLSVRVQFHLFSSFRRISHLKEVVNEFRSHLFFFLLKNCSQTPRF